MYLTQSTSSTFVIASLIYLLQSFSTSVPETRHQIPFSHLSHGVCIDVRPPQSPNNAMHGYVYWTTSGSFYLADLPKTLSSRQGVHLCPLLFSIKRRIPTQTSDRLHPLSTAIQRYDGCCSAGFRDVAKSSRSCSNQFLSTLLRLRRPTHKRSRARSTPKNALVSRMPRH